MVNRSYEAWPTTRTARLDGVVQPNRSIPSATVIPVLSYPDVRAAVTWLAAALGFDERVRIGIDHRAQLSLGDGAVIVADTGGDRRPPDPAVITHSVTVRVADVDARCERARREGATIVAEPTDFPYGERQCTLQDPWGHRVDALPDSHRRRAGGVGRRDRHVRLTGVRSARRLRRRRDR